jgi:hypothetical protein
VQAYSEGVTDRHGALVGTHTGAAKGEPVSDGGPVGTTTGPPRGAKRTPRAV